MKSHFALVSLFILVFALVFGGIIQKVSNEEDAFRRISLILALSSVIVGISCITIPDYIRKVKAWRSPIKFIMLSFFLILLIILIGYKVVWVDENKLLPAVEVEQPRVFPEV